MVGATYVDIICKELHDAGWSYGDVAAVEGETLLYLADAHKGEHRCVARVDTLLTAYAELKAMAVKVDGKG
jgi:hypothetical protein